jgi:hypothetical protein
MRQLNNPTPPRVLFDLTRHEPVLDDPHPRGVFHPYPDTLPEGASILAYSMEELLAEKTRALYERTRPRDLYDVVYILDNPPRLLQFDLTHGLFRQKCEVKSLQFPDIGQLIALARADEELRSEWANMLAHQLPDLPELDTLLARLPALLAWIEEPAVVRPEMAFAGPPFQAGELSVPVSGIRYWGTGIPLETIRFAGANRLLVEFDYHGKHRHAEPYSLRQAATGNLLLYAWELASQQIKAFKIAEMLSVSSTRAPFTPRFQIELATAGEPVPMAATSTRSLPASYPATYIGRPSTRLQQKTGPTYIFRCYDCGKEFRHSRNDPTLRKHKAQGGGWDCPGRRGYYVRTDY